MSKRGQIDSGRPRIVLQSRREQVVPVAESIPSPSTLAMTGSGDRARPGLSPDGRAESTPMAPSAPACHDARDFGGLIGVSRAMLSVHDLVRRVARTDAPVMISGETGTGKEVVAQAIHSLSRRREQPFLPVNCGAVSVTLSESELFGHERGSFTGAERLHRGYFERADRGTLFLDEIAEMPLDLQVKLLRVLESSAVGRVGGTTAHKVDVRVIAATNRPPGEAVAEGRLREDLFYRLNVLTIDLPPLRERGADVLLLAERFLAELNLAEQTAKAFTPPCLERLRQYHWPGNVRELRNVVQRSFVQAEDVELDCAFLPRRDWVESRDEACVSSEAPSLVVPLGSTLAEVERRLLLATLAHVGGDKIAAAAVLGVSLKTMYNRLREYRS
jgi:two-component system, NtrC family, response regulator AtoC